MGSKDRVVGPVFLTSAAMIASATTSVDRMEALCEELDRALHPFEPYADDERTDPGVRLERDLEPLGDLTLPRLRLAGRESK